MRRMLAALAVLCVFPAMAASAAEHLSATSNTAMSITGDVTLEKGHIVFGNGKSVAVKLVAKNKAGHWGVLDPGITKADVYELKTPQDPKLLNGNTLCGLGPVRYIAFRHGKGDFVEMIVFRPKADPFASGPDSLCGTYNFGG